LDSWILESIRNKFGVDAFKALVAQTNVVVLMVHLELLYKPAAISRGKTDGRLVVVSNRVPLPSSSVAPAAGGLAVALHAALKPRGGLWFGWSGKTSEESEPAAQCRTVGSLTYAVCDLSRRDIEQYYCGFANRAIWPICHYRLDLANLSECNAAAYFRVNEQFARQLHKLLRRDDIIWVHDYHLIPMARFLRQMGCANRIGFFLHVPWPGPDVASALPAYQRILRCFGAYDVVGFQTEADAGNFRDCIVSANAGLVAGGDWCEIDGRRMISWSYAGGAALRQPCTICRSARFPSASTPKPSRKRHVPPRKIARSNACSRASRAATSSSASIGSTIQRA
jgi:trehalose 6-phosphate synthase